MSHKYRIVRLDEEYFVEYKYHENEDWVRTGHPFESAEDIDAYFESIHKKDGEATRKNKYYQDNKVVIRELEAYNV